MKAEIKTKELKFEISEFWNKILEMMLSWDPSKRPSASELLNTLYGSPDLWLKTPRGRETCSWNVDIKHVVFEKYKLQKSFVDLLKT